MLLSEEGPAKTETRAMVAWARDEILKSGGSLSHHHGVGKLRRHFLPRIMSETALQWKRDLKKTLDPTNVFGAGNQGLDTR